MPSAADQIEVNSDRSCHFERGGKSEVAVVLSCPGSSEEKSTRPASGMTGRNLDFLLEKLGPLVGIPDLVRSDVTVTNAFTGVEYKARTGRSQASFEEILRDSNIDRLNTELADISDLVLFCGDRAHAVARRVTLRTGTKLVCVPHPGMQGINQIARDIYGVPILSVADSKAGGDKRSAKEIGLANTARRIDVLVRRALDQVK